MLLEANTVFATASSPSRERMTARGATLYTAEARA